VIWINEMPVGLCGSVTLDFKLAPLMCRHFSSYKPEHRLYTLVHSIIRHEIFMIGRNFPFLKHSCVAEMLFPPLHRPKALFIVALFVSHTCFTQLIWQCPPLSLMDLLLGTPKFCLLMPVSPCSWSL